MKTKMKIEELLQKAAGPGGERIQAAVRRGLRAGGPEDAPGECLVRVRTYLENADANLESEPEFALADLIGAAEDIECLVAAAWAKVAAVEHAGPARRRPAHDQPRA